jgi:hypothetical protein
LLSYFLTLGENVMRFFRRLCRAPLWVLVVLLTAIDSHQAEASLVQWTLSGVTFNDGGTASGSFDYDADIQAVSGFDVTTTAGTALPGDHYLDLHGDQPPYPPSGFAVLDILDPANLTGSPFIALNFGSPLSNAGGVIPLVHGISEGFCLNVDCSFGDYRRSIAAGAVVGVDAAVPEPATLSLLAIAVAALGCRRRKRATDTPSVNQRGGFDRGRRGGGRSR